MPAYLSKQALASYYRKRLLDLCSDRMGLFKICCCLSEEAAKAGEVWSAKTADIDQYKSDLNNFDKSGILAVSTMCPFYAKVKCLNINLK